MCSRCITSPGASEHITSIASWSPRKSDPLTVSYACECQSSSTLIAALMPPAAATECERTGWTLLMIATLAPARAAARAARWPARPAPMIKTSCAGIGRSAVGCSEGRCAEDSITRLAAAALEPVDAPPRRSRCRPQRAAHLRQRDDTPQHAVGVDRHHRAEAAEALGAEQGLERVVLVDAHGHVLLQHVHDRKRRTPGRDLVLHA